MLTHEIVKILADKKPRSVAEVAELTGQSKEKVHNAFTSLLRNGMADAEPVRYRVTAIGMKRAAWRPQTAREKLDKQNRKMRERRAAARTAAVEKANALDQSARTMRAGAVNSVFALGGAR